jgi:hypothetical protein
VGIYRYSHRIHKQANRQGGTMRRLCGLLGLLWAGCMPLGYVYPSISYVRPATVGAARDQVRAFRIDVTDDDNSYYIPEGDSYVLTQLPLNEDGGFDPQLKVATDFGWFLDAPAFMHGSARHHTVLVRLYRPGYHTLELGSWRGEERLHWTTAPTPQEQEQAIDDLVSTWRTSPIHIQCQYAVKSKDTPRDSILFRYLAPGSISDEHREALCFAAGEYERLSNEVSDAQLRSRMQEKAKALRQLVTR